jgi:hypothetical protein
VLTGGGDGLIEAVGHAGFSDAILVHFTDRVAATTTGVIVAPGEPFAGAWPRADRVGARR